MSSGKEEPDRTDLGEENRTTDEQSERRKLFPMKVNGIEISAPSKKLSALEILQLAKRAGAMPGEPESYILQGDKGKYQENDPVDLEDDNQFITIPVKSTQVA